MLNPNNRHTHIYASLLFALLAAHPVYAEVMDNGHYHEMEDQAHAISFGLAADPADAERTVEIIADDITFSPASVSIKRGEIIKFRITNQGSVLHEMVLGTKEAQIAHNAEMQNMSQTEITGHMQSSATGIAIQPGQTEEITWNFSTTLEEVEFACHIPGHYEAGMYGLISISKDNR